ncbi:G-protein coupled receptor 39-like [Aplysia californica]|uniref:G-protein coupled receptor 39-like n=1 Tax=Aplysia californica TaxID=6500 RepID=A0ABM1W2I7_APLCA|nr:G-protein coupled receptor 39-like [Aplysia californica]
MLFSILGIANDTNLSIFEDSQSSVPGTGNGSSAIALADDVEAEGKSLNEPLWRTLLVSDDTRAFFELLNYVIIVDVVCTFGVLSNILNIVVFVKLGLKDTVNIAFSGSPKTDLGSVLSLLWASVCRNPLLLAWEGGKARQLDYLGVQYLTASWPQGVFFRVIQFITGFLGGEKGLGVAFSPQASRAGECFQPEARPVKSLVTPRRTKLAVLTIYVTMLSAVIPAFCSMHFRQTVDLETNTTLLRLVYITPDGQALEGISFAINNFCLLTSFLIVVTCTAILVRKLTVKTKWRMQTASGDVDKKEAIARKDEKVVKMVVIICVVFVVCYSLSSVNMALMLFLPDYSVVGPYRNIFQVVWSFIDTLEGVNSSVNIFVYFKMSSKFRRMFKNTFCCRTELK